MRAVSTGQGPGRSGAVGQSSEKQVQKGSR